MHRYVYWLAISWVRTRGGWELRSWKALYSHLRYIRGVFIFGDLCLWLTTRKCLGVSRGMASVCLYHVEARILTSVNTSYMNGKITAEGS